MVPVHDLNPVRRVPWVTWFLLALNVIVFLGTPASIAAGIAGHDVADLCRQEAFYQRYGAVPQELVTNRPLPVTATGDVGIGPGGLGCLIGPRQYHKVPFLSVLSAMFVHGGLLHLAGNMLFLVIFGNNVEDRLGRIRFLLFYLVCGYASAYGFALAYPTHTQPLVGASGAVSGVLGAYVVLFPRAKVWSLVPVLFFLPIRLPAWLVLGMWFLIQWVYSAGYAVSEAGSVAYLAHVVGFVLGMSLALLARGRGPEPYPLSRPRPGW